VSVVIVDYGVGNLGSVLNMLKRIGVSGSISSDAAAIAAAPKLLLPGVGAFDAAMNRLNDSGLRPALERRVAEGVPLLGICLGMQLLTRSSEEGALPGLGLVPARTLGFKGRVPADTKVPHMGWNRVSAGSSSALTSDLVAEDEARFYFVHSYYVECAVPEQSILKTTYGVTFDSGFQCGNIFGVQFHPEKSHRFGMKLLQSFARI